MASSDHQSLTYPTIRHSSCEYLLPQDSTPKCQECRDYASTLRAQLSRHNSHQTAAHVARTDPSSHVSYQSLTEEKMERMKHLHKKLRQTENERDRLKAKLARVIESQGVVVDSESNADLHNITQTEALQVMEKFPPGSFQRTFGSSRLRLPHARMLMK